MTFITITILMEECRRRGVVGGASYVIRRAVETDIPAVMYVNRVSLPENYPRSFFEDLLRRWGKAFYVAEHDGEIVGYIMCRVEWGLGFIRRGLVRKGHVISVAVLKPHRRRGLGTQLMLAAMRDLKDSYRASEVYLEVRVSNIPAIRLYEKLGFRVVRRVPMYYLDGEDAYVMAKEL